MLVVVVNGTPAWTIRLRRCAYEDCWHYEYEMPCDAENRARWAAWCIDNPAEEDDEEEETR